MRLLSPHSTADLHGDGHDPSARHTLRPARHPRPRRRYPIRYRSPRPGGGARVVARSLLQVRQPRPHALLLRRRSARSHGGFRGGLRRRTRSSARGPCRWGLRRETRQCRGSRTAPCRRVHQFAGPVRQQHRPRPCPPSQRPPLFSIARRRHHRLQPHRAAHARAAPRRSILDRAAQRQGERPHRRRPRCFASTRSTTRSRCSLRPFRACSTSTIKSPASTT